MDFVKDNTTGNASSRGDWEHAAKDAVVSMSHWTLVLALLALIAALLVLWRRPQQMVLEATGIDPIVGAPETRAGRAPGRLPQRLTGTSFEGFAQVFRAASVRAGVNHPLLFPRTEAQT